MSVNHYSITKNDLLDLFARLAETNKVFVPYKYNDKTSGRTGFYFGEFVAARESEMELGGVRPGQPFKSFTNPAREIVAGKDNDNTGHVIVAGVKACDLSSLTLQDYVFLKGDCEDPFYAFHRNNTTIISCDCTFAKETCFCTAMSGKPYPTRDYDLNLSSLEGRFIAQAQSDKGSKIVDTYKTFFKDCANKDLLKRENMREEVSLQVKDFIKKRGTPDTTAMNGAVKKNYDNLNLWQDAASTCVECGACNLVCPTCHCFLLFDAAVKPGIPSTSLGMIRGMVSTSNHNSESGRRVDEKAGEKTIRGKVWDACLYKTFAKVAGDHNPRKHLYERMRNRFDKKFAFFPEVLNYYACTGCGRCIEACPGNIDIREVLKGLVTGKWNKPPHK